MHSSSSSTSVSLYPVNPSFPTQTGIRRKPSIHFPTPPKYQSLACKAANKNSIADFDLYELLGIDSSCNQAQIKLAYRALQKKCHPDIAGPDGHDMAIVLNEAYELLSDPNSRLAYDKEHAKFSDFQGYTGKPIYSVWLGDASEKRAVFVDEVRCIGCLKCALFAEKTFAIESVHGRARVVSQWADPEDKIQAAIEICPVDCISMVERSDLAALEFLMSKKPRESVRIGAGNTVGARTSSIFDDLEKFQARYLKNKGNSKEADIYWEAKASAVQAIRAITNWLYWQTPPGEQFQNLIASKKKIAEPNLERIKEVAEARKQARESMQNSRVSSSNLNESEYWDPSKHVFPDSDKIESDSGTEAQSPVTSSSVKTEGLREEDLTDMQQETENQTFLWSVPIVFAIVAAVVVRSRLGDAPPALLEEHVGGSRLRDVVNSNWLQTILAGVTWYLIGMAIMELVVTVQSRLKKNRVGGDKS